MKQDPERLLRLDGLRGVAACIVSFLFHARMLFGSVQNPFDGVPGFGWFQQWGWSAVDLFFVLSGFVFAHCYLDDWRLRAGTTISSFALSRFARLWPLHAVVLGFTVVILHQLPQTNLSNVLASLAMLQVFLADPTQTLNGPAWSLSVEVLCYGLFILAAAAGARVLQASAAVAILIGAGCIFAFGVWDALVARGFLGFFCGVFLRRHMHHADRMPGATLAVFAALPFIIVPDGGWLVLTTLVAWPAAILLALRVPVLEARPMVWLGDRSYTIYLVHMPVYLLSLALFSGISGMDRTAWLAATLATWGVILLVADLLYRNLERPSQRAILSRFGKRRAGIVDLPERLAPDDRRGVQ